MANFTLSTSQVAGGGGSVTVTPVSASVFTGRKATGTVTIKNGTATKTVSLSKDYPLTDSITKVMVGSTNIPDWRGFNIPATSTTIEVTIKSNRSSIALYVDGNLAPVACSIKIGSIWISESGVSETTEQWFQLTGEVSNITLPNNLGLTSEYTATIKIKASANPKSYPVSSDVYIGLDSITYTQAAATATLTVTPTSLSWTSSETAGKAITVSSNGSTLPVTVA